MADRPPGVALPNDPSRSCEQLSTEAAAEMRSLEDALDADYRRCSAEKSLAFNLAHAEGFEAMIPAMLRTLSPGYNPRDVAIPDDVISIAASQGVDLR